MQNNQLKVKESNEEIINEKSVATFLRRNPDFFVKNEKVLLDLTIPAVTGGNITSFSQFQTAKLKQEIEHLKERNKLLIKTSLDNLESEKHIHALVLNMLSSKDKNELFSILQSYICNELGLKLVFIETSNNLPEEELNRLISPEQKVKMRTIFKSTQREIYNNDEYLVYEVCCDSKKQTEEIKSDALLRLENGDTFHGILAIGSYDEGHFHEGQASDLLEFLAGTVSHCLNMFAHNKNV